MKITIQKWLIFLLISATSLPAARPWRSHAMDVLHYRLQFSFVPEEHRVTGEAEISFRSLREGLDSISLDAVNFENVQIMSGADTIMGFRNNGRALQIPLLRQLDFNQTQTIRISYEAEPERGLFFFNPTAKEPNQRTQIWSQGEGEDNRYWFPGYDSPNDKATAEIIVTVPAGQTVVSNGRLLGKIEREDKTIWYYQLDQPSPMYLISLVIGEFRLYTDEFRGRPVEYFVYPETDKETAYRSFGRTPDMLRFFSDYTGFEYPFPKYSQALITNFMFSGMENISATTITDRTIHDISAHHTFESDGLVAHELAHQWFGDLVTCRDWSEIWLNEGFATYFTNLYYRDWKGDDDFRFNLWRGIQIPVIEAELKHPRHLSGEQPGLVYTKGASVLHMLREKIGDNAFRAGIQAYTRNSAFGHAGSNDFKKALEDAGGQNLNTFFDEWIYRPGVPQIKTWHSYQKETKNLYLYFEQLQDSLLYHLELPLAISAGGKEKTTTVFTSTRRDTITIPLDTEPEDVVINSNTVVLAEIQQEKDWSLWFSQASKSQFLMNRLAAYEKLTLTDNHSERDKTVKFLTERLGKAENPFEREQAAFVLSKINSFSDRDKKTATRELIRQLKEEKTARIRIEILRSLTQLTSDFSLTEIKKVFQKDNAVAVRAEALRCLIRKGEHKKLDYIELGLQTDSWDELIREAVFNEIDSTLGADQRLQIARRYFMAGNHPKLRSLAVGQLSDLARQGNTEAKELLMVMIEEGVGEHRYRPLIGAIRTMTRFPEYREQLQQACESILLSKGNLYAKEGIRNLKKQGIL